MVFPVNLATAAARELKNIILDTRDQVNSDKPIYLRDGTPESILGQLTQETARQACRKWPNERQGLDPGTDAAWDRLCKPFLEGLGEYPGPPSFGVPTVGAPCDFLYSEIRFTSTSRGNAMGPQPGLNPVFFDIDNFQGPLQSFTLVNQGQLGSFVRAIDGNGNPRDSDTSNFVYGVALFSTDPADAGCGPPPSTYVPSDPVMPPADPFPFSPTPDFNIDIDVDFNPDGTINIEFDDGSGDPPVEVPVDPDTPGSEGEPDGGKPGPSVDTGEGGEAAGEEELRELVGVQTDILVAPPFARTEAVPSGTRFRGSQYVYLGNGDQLDLQPEGAIAVSGQFFFAPEGSNAWRVVASPGYNLRVTPYYKDL